MRAFGEFCCHRSITREMTTSKRFAADRRATFWRRTNAWFLLLCLFYGFVSSTCYTSGSPIIDISEEGELNGAADNLTDLQVLEDRIGSEMELSAHLPVQKFQVIHASASGKLSRAFRNYIVNHRKLSARTKYVIAPSGWSTVGLVEYMFDNPESNTRGSSYQTLLLCRCLTKACNFSISAVPVAIVSDNKPNVEVGRSCLYLMHRSSKRISRCVNALLNFTSVEDAEAPLDAPLLSGRAKSFRFAVDNPLVKWKAQGVRGAGYTTSLNNFTSLLRYNLKSINITRLLTAEDLLPASGAYQFVRSTEKLNTGPCSETITFASEGGAWNGGQSDPVAVGLIDELFTKLKPEIFRVPEIMLIVAATVIAQGAIMKILYSQGFTKRTWYVLVTTFCIYVVESVVVYITYAKTVVAFRWRGHFLSLEGILAVHRASQKNQWDATDSMIVLNAIVGTARYRKTYHTAMIIVFLGSFILMMISVICFLIMKARYRQGQPEHQNRFSRIVSSKPPAHDSNIESVCEVVCD